MTIRTGFFALLAATASCSSAARNPVLDSYPSGIIGRTTVDYYDVHGRTLAELRADMRRLGPKIADSSFVGETRAPMRWSWKTESNGTSSCTIRDATVTVTAQILLPRWTPPADAEPGLVAEWQRFIAALETHEAGHKDIAAKAAREIRDKVRDLAGPCAMINTRANDVARVIIEKAHEQQRAYDAETRHGGTQGTGFGRTLSQTVTRAPDQLLLLTPPRIGTVRGPFPETIERTWNAMPAVYSALGLAINARDTSAHVVGDSLTIRAPIGELAVSEMVDCGTLPGARSGDSTVVTLFVTSRIEPNEPTGIWVTNTVQAYTRAQGGPAVACRSLGALERRLLIELRRQLAGGRPK